MGHVRRRNAFAADRGRHCQVVESGGSRSDLGSKGNPVQTSRFKLSDRPRLRTMIVEDSPVILSNLIAALEEMTPVQVVGSAPGERSALERLAQMNDGIDLLIVDLFLEQGSGLGVLRATAQSKLQAKRVVLTNFATMDIRNKCKELGADRVFDKSTELDSLISYCAALVTQAGPARPASPG